MISLPNPFTDSAAFHPLAVDTVAALTSQPPVAAAVPIPVSPGVFQGSLPSGEIEPSVMLACAPGESTDDIHEIFHYARLLIAEDNAVHRRFVLDERAFMDAIDEAPLFLRMA